MFRRKSISEAGARSTRISRFSFSTKRVPLASLISVVLGAQTCLQASVVFEMTPVDNSAVLSGFVTYDLQVTTEKDWTSAAMLVQLDEGQIYQHAFGGNSDLQFLSFATSDPALMFDTHVKGTIAGGAGDLDGTGFAFTTQRLDVSWYNIDRSDIGTTAIGRLTLSDDATGTMAFYTDEQRFDVVLGAGIAPVVTAVVEEEPEAEPVPECPTTSLPTGTYWDNSDWYRCPVFPGGYEVPFVPIYSTRPDDNRVWTPSVELGGLFKDKYSTDPIERVRRPVDFIDGRNEFVINTSFVDTSPVLVSTDGATLPEPGTAVCLGLGLGLMVRRRHIV